jgi:putative ABC transport system substrate-binding protein
MSLLTELDAFYTSTAGTAAEAGVEGPTVWFDCECGARTARRATTATYLTSTVETPHHPGMDRRRFLLTSLAGAVAAPVGAGAQPSGRVYRIGILSELAPTPAAAGGPRALFAEDDWRTAFRRRGYVEGQNTVFEFRHAGEQFERLPALVDELVRLNVAIIITASTPPALAAKRATTTIPIITISADPIGAGLVATLARPGGNVTGLLSLV